MDTTQNKGRNGFLSQPCGGPGGKTGRKNEGRGMHEEAKASLNLAEKELLCSKGEQKISMAFNPPGPSIFPRRNVSIFWTLWGTFPHFPPSVRAYTPTPGDFQSPGLLPFRGKLPPSLPYSPPASLRITKMRASFSPSFCQPEPLRLAASFGRGHIFCI